MLRGCFFVNGVCFLFFFFPEGNGDQAELENRVPAFKEYGLNELRKATNGFSSGYIVSESGEKAPNVVYKGKLDNNRVVAVKRFSKQSWPDAEQFVVRRRKIHPFFVSSRGKNEKKGR